MTVNKVAAPTGLVKSCCRFLRICIRLHCVEAKATNRKYFYSDFYHQSLEFVCRQMRSKFIRSLIDDKYKFAVTISVVYCYFKY